MTQYRQGGGAGNAAIVPSSQQKIANIEGYVTTPWQRFFNALVSAPGPFQTITVTTSPFIYTAGSGGSLAVSGGTVSGIALTRSGTSLSTSLSGGIIPVANGDQVTITYSVAPSVVFIPS